MTPVRLTRCLTLERPEPLPDGSGGFSMTWIALGLIWADMQPGVGRDTGGEEVTLATMPYRITVRGAPVGSARRPVAGQRFREGSRLFAILAVSERDAAGKYLTCFAKEEAPA